MKALYLGLMCGSNGFTEAFKNNFCEYKELNCGDYYFNENSIELAKSFKPDLIFIQIQASGIISEFTIKTLKETGAFVVNWTGDVRSPIPSWYYDIGRHADLTCFSNLTDVLEFRKSGLKSEFLDIGYDPRIYKEEGRTIPTREVVFLGNNYGGGYFPLSNYRIKMVDFLKENQNEKFAFYGNGWNFSFGDWNNSQESEASIYRGAKIGINLSHFNYNRYSSDRVLRIMGSGAMCLTKRYNGIELDYEDGVDLVVWDTFEDLNDKIEFYLKNEEERIKITQNGNKKVSENHTFDNMIKNIIKLVK